MKVIYLIFSLVISILLPPAKVFSQNYLYSQFVSKQKEASAARLKVVKGYSYKNALLRRPKLILEEHYDSSGNILKQTEHKYYRYKHFYEETYQYDSLGRILNITSKSTYRDHVYSTTLIYGTGNNVKYLITGKEIPPNLTTDTIFYLYFPDGRVRLSYRGQYQFGVLIKYDTTYHNYRIEGATRISPNKNDTTINKVSRNEYDCILSNQVSTNYKYTEVRDSACRIISHKEEELVEGIWLTYSSCEFRYDGNNLIETKCYDYKRKLKGSNVMHLNFWDQFDYNEYGYITTHTRLNKRGKIIEIRKYFYETYSF